jgi:hypothetical protein
MILNLANNVEATELSHGNSLISGKKSGNAAFDRWTDLGFLDWVYWRS